MVQVLSYPTLGQQLFGSCLGRLMAESYGLTLEHPGLPLSVSPRGKSAAANTFRQISTLTGIGLAFAT